MENPPRGPLRQSKTLSGVPTDTTKGGVHVDAKRQECCQQGGGLKAHATQIWGLFASNHSSNGSWKPGLINPEHVQPILDRGTANYIRDHFGPKVRVGYGSYAAHLRNKETAAKLNPREWPSFRGRSLWPSTLSINELLVSGTRGWSGYPDFPPPPAVERVGVREFNGNPLLAEEIVRRNVVGLRSDIEIPVRYLSHFRYCRNFLILTAPRLPIGLVRFLASVWITDPYSLWLERKVSFKKFLKVYVAKPVVSTCRARWAAPDPYLRPSAEGGSPSLDFDYTDSESE